MKFQSVAKICTSYPKHPKERAPTADVLVQVDIGFRCMDCFNQRGDSYVLSALRPGMSLSVPTAAKTPSNAQPHRIGKAALVLL